MTDHHRRAIRRALHRGAFGISFAALAVIPPTAKIMTLILDIGHHLA